jgi:pilus assembly protein CpaB
VNPKQRRGIIFLAFAIIGAIAVFFAVVGYVNDVESQVGNRAQAWVFKKDVDAYQTVTASDLSTVEIPERYMPDGAVTDLDGLVGKVTSAAISSGTLLQTSNMVPQPSLLAGQREIAIMVDAATSVAGKVSPGDHVDVWATFSKDTTDVGPRTKLIAQDLLVISVGEKTDRQKQTLTGDTTTEQMPITFATAEEQIKALTFAESFAIETRLALRPPGDSTTVPGNARTYAETFKGANR